MKSEVMIFLSFTQLIVTLSVRWYVGKAFYTLSIVNYYFILSSVCLKQFFYEQISF